MTVDLNYGVKLITRAEWGARKPRSVTSLRADVNTDHWEGPHMGWPWVHESCFSKVRGIQNFHMDSRGWTDIAYSTLSCGHGWVFEGRGRGVRTAANGTNSGNGGSFADCYLGGQGDEFTEAGRRAKRAAGDWLTHVNSPRLGHRDWKSTECPGNTIYAWTHAGQPVPIHPPVPPIIPKGKDDVLSLVKAPNKPEIYLVSEDYRLFTNNVAAPQGVNELIWFYTVAGFEVKRADGNKPFEWPEWMIAVSIPRRPGVDDKAIPFAK